MSRRHKTKHWWPGIYEGRTPDQVRAQVGTRVAPVNTHIKGNPTLEQAPKFQPLDRGVTARY